MDIDKEMDDARTAGYDFVAWCDENGYSDVARPWENNYNHDAARYDEAMRLFAAWYWPAEQVSP